MICSAEVNENVVPSSYVVAVPDHLQHVLARHGRGGFVTWRRVGSMPGCGSISRGHLLGPADAVDVECRLECELSVRTSA